MHSVPRKRAGQGEVLTQFTQMSLACCGRLQSWPQNFLLCDSPWQLTPLIKRWNLSLSFVFRLALGLALAMGMVANMTKAEPRKVAAHQGLAFLLLWKHRYHIYLQGYLPGGRGMRWTKPDLSPPEPQPSAAHTSRGQAMSHLA